MQELKTQTERLKELEAEAEKIRQSLQSESASVLKSLREDLTNAQVAAKKHVAEITEAEEALAEWREHLKDARENLAKVQGAWTARLRDVRQIVGLEAVKEEAMNVRIADDGSLQGLYIRTAGKE